MGHPTRLARFRPSHCSSSGSRGPCAWPS
jgi:hypothetical protein